MPRRRRNFDVDNPDRAFMDHLLDWKLIHRSPQDLADLFSQSQFGHAPVEVRREATGINLFASARRPAGKPFGDPDGPPGVIVEK